MKIGINARTLSDEQLRGWSRYTINLIQALAKFDAHFFLFSDRELNDEFLKRIPKRKYTVVVEPADSYFFWEQRVLARLCRKYAVDILHCPINYGIPFRSPCPTVLTLHDAIEELYYAPQESFGQKIKLGTLLWKLSSKISRRRADRIITVSEFSKNDFVTRLRVPAEKVHVIYEAADPLFDNRPGEHQVKWTTNKYEIQSPYIFYVGGWEQRKNVRFLLESFREVKGAQLVLAGGKTDEREKLINEFSDLEKRVHFLGWIPDETLPTLYTGARAFVYPSEYEGFGLQVCEAMSVGCPVFVANRASLPEISGDGGISFSLEKTSELKEWIKKIISDEEFYEQRRAAALERSKDFSWRKTAEETWQVYLSLVN